MILSASRRTDLPGYYSEWFINRCKEGFALYRNPMNHAQIGKVLLSPETIDCIIFWTKDPLDMMDKLGQLGTMGFHYYFQFTLTPYDLPYDVLSNKNHRAVLPAHDLTTYGKKIEPNLRDKVEIIKTFQQLSDRLGRHRVLWRYDPIILNDTFTMEYHLDMFKTLCKELSGYTNICTISFVDRYSKLSSKVKEQVVKEITVEQMHRMAVGLVEIARPYGIELRACCETIDLSADGIKPASCIDKDVIEQICGHAITAKKDKSQRPQCGCLQSVDIGAYNTCKNGCVYCYANHSEASIKKNCERHDPNSPMLIGTIET
jgi:hypothetical protein